MPARPPSDRTHAPFPTASPQAEAQLTAVRLPRGARVDAHWGRPHMVMGARTVAPPWTRPQTRTDSRWRTPGSPTAFGGIARRALLSRSRPRAAPPLRSIAHGEAM